MQTIFSNTGSSGRGQRGINFKDRAGNGRAAELGVRAVQAKEVCVKIKYGLNLEKDLNEAIVF